MAVDSHANDFARNLDRTRSQAAVLLACIMLSGKTLDIAFGRLHTHQTLHYSACSDVDVLSYAITVNINEQWML
jgi:hypothetical protein